MPDALVQLQANHAISVTLWNVNTSTDAPGRIYITLQGECADLVPELGRLTIDALKALNADE